MEKLTPSEPTHGAPNATLQVTPSLVMRLPLLLVSLVLVLPSRAIADEALWQLMRGGGQVILMRHAVTTPGVGDPAGFKLRLLDAAQPHRRRT